ncbi:UNVERIFIED_CONTAM: hypothetical protein NCL1_32957 [Trichonephila clavipes]
MEKASLIPGPYVSTGNYSNWWRLCDEEISTHLTTIGLWTALQDSWGQLPPTLLETLIESMVLRVVALLRAYGDPTQH